MVGGRAGRGRGGGTSGSELKPGGVEHGRVQARVGTVDDQDLEQLAVGVVERQLHGVDSRPVGDGHGELVVGFGVEEGRPVYRVVGFAVDRIALELQRNQHIAATFVAGHTRFIVIDATREPPKSTGKSTNQVSHAGPQRCAKGSRPEGAQVYRWQKRENDLGTATQAN